MAKSNDNFKYEVNKDYDFILEESANTSICLRKISWNDRPEKLDIRKYTYSDGQIYKSGSKYPLTSSQKV